MAALRNNLGTVGKYFVGAGRQAQAFNGKSGIPVDFYTFVDFGAPVTLDADGLIVAATGAELPNASTKTYTLPAVSASPQDGANLTGILDVPRNITAVTTHGTSVVAMTIVLTGKDQYGVPLVQTLSVPATGTSQTVNGTKAFKSITTIAITAATDATANTLNMGWGDVLGLPFRLGGKWDILASWQDTTMELATATVVAGVTTTATATTGDTRGTYTPATATNGTRAYRLHMRAFGLTNTVESYGVNQFGG